MKRRLATLATLARLDDRRMRQAATDLSALQECAARLAAEARLLDRRRQCESAVTMVEAMPYLGRFLATLRREMDRIGTERAKAELAAEAKRDEVLEAWRDLRPKEQLQESLRARLRDERMRAEQTEQDERAGQAHARRLRINPPQAVPE